MGIQRQVIAEQIDVMPQQQLQAPLLLSDHAHVFTAPEIAMMDQDGIGLPFPAASIRARLAVTPLTTRPMVARPSTCKPFGQ
jgi:hypothetical protein